MILSGETSAYRVFEDPSSRGTQSATALQSLLRAYVRTLKVINFPDSTRSSAESYPGMCVGEKIFLFVCLYFCIFVCRSVCVCVCSMEEDVALYVV